MLEDLQGPPANPSSVHHFGARAKKILQAARRNTANFFGASPEEIIFTSGGTESVNLMLRGLPKGHIVTTNIEHASIYKTAKALEPQGVSFTYISCGLWGAPTAEQIEMALQPNTRAIILSLANSETGVKMDVEPIANIAEKYGILLLLDGVSFLGKDPLSSMKGIHALAISGHKFHAPKGIGVLFRRRSLKLQPAATGGNQEYMQRAGTENLSGILGISKALQILQESQLAISSHLLDLRTRFESELFRALPDLAINGLGPRISNTVNIAFLGCDGESLLMQLDLAGIAVSLGSACSSGALEPSRILTNMGLHRKTAQSSIRFSFSRNNTREEIDLALERLVPLVIKLRGLSLN